MSYSYYEVYTNSQRAFSGLGFPYGADEDAAFIISWLEAFELSGIHLFANIQKKGYVELETPNMCIYHVGLPRTRM